MVSAAGHPIVAIQYYYDYLGRRVRTVEFSWSGSAWVAVDDHRLIYNGWNLVAEFWGPYAGGSFPTNNVRHSFWGLDLSGSLSGAGGVGGLLMVQEGGNSYLPAYDAVGNVHAMIKASDGSFAAAYEYDAFGNTLRESGPYAASNPFRFATKYTDIETGLVQYNLRYYSPSLGRFINRDPIEERGGMNLYAYVRNQVANKWDYVGLVEPPEELLEGGNDVGSSWNLFSDGSLNGFFSGDFMGDFTGNDSSEWHANNLAPTISYDQAWGRYGNAAVGGGVLLNSAETGRLLGTAGAFNSSLEGATATTYRVVVVDTNVVFRDPNRTASITTFPIIIGGSGAAAGSVIASGGVVLVGVGAYYVGGWIDEQFGVSDAVSRAIVGDIYKSDAKPVIPGLTPGDVGFPEKVGPNGIPEGWVPHPSVPGTYIPGGAKPGPGTPAIHPDPTHPVVPGVDGPHTDWAPGNGTNWRIYPDGNVQPKNNAAEKVGKKKASEKSKSDKSN